MLTPRGLLDADNPLASIVNPIEAALTGVTQEDIAAGTIDASELSRSDKATLAIDGELPSLLEPVLRPWTVGLDISSGDVGKLAANGGGGLLFRCTEAFLDALVDKVVAPRFALLWDDSIVEAQGVLDTGAFSDTTLQISIGPPRGSRLTLWCTDSGVKFELVQNVAPDGVTAQRERARAEASGETPGFLEGFGKQLQHFLDTALASQTALGVAAVVVGGAVLYLYLKDKG